MKSLRFVAALGLLVLPATIASANGSNQVSLTPAGDSTNNTCFEVYCGDEETSRGLACGQTVTDIITSAEELCGTT